VRAGKVLYVGISDAPAWVVAKSNTIAELRGWTRYAGLQINYSLLERTVERELIPVAKRSGDDGGGVVAAAQRVADRKISSGKQVCRKPRDRLDSEMMKGFASVDKSGLVELDESGLRTVASRRHRKGIRRSPAQWPWPGFDIVVRSSPLSEREGSINWKTT